MKKIFLIVLLCAYALSSMGVGLKEFYCCGKLKSVFISLTDNNKQACTKEGCCKTKQHFLKQQDNHVAGADIHLPTKHFTALHDYTTAYQIIPLVRQTNFASQIHAPPLYNDDVPLYLSNCIFRI